MCYLGPFGADGPQLDEIARAGDAEWRSNRNQKDGAESRSEPAAPKGRLASEPPVAVDPAWTYRESTLTGAMPAALPHDVKPMLATLTDEPFDREGWLFEIKWDGFRAVAELSGGEVLLYSRNRLAFNDRYAAIVRDLHGLRFDAVIDGEVVVLDEAGRPAIQAPPELAQ